MEEIKKIPQRSEIAAEDKWATEDLYPSDEAWEQEMATVAEDAKELASFAGHLGESAQQLCAYLTKMEQVNYKGELLATIPMGYPLESPKAPKRKTDRYEYL